MEKTSNILELPPSINDKLLTLLKIKDEQLRILKAILSTDNCRLYMIDLLVIAVIQRSLSLIDGFSIQVRQQNVLCAIPLIRLQLDSVMRLYACSLVDPSIVVKKVLSGEPLHQVKTADGEKLNDKYLCTAVSKRYPWVDRVYKSTSGFIHLSTPHMVSTIRDMDDSTGSIEMLISLDGTGRKWTEDEIIESIDAFTEATKILNELYLSWFDTKSKS